MSVVSNEEAKLSLLHSVDRLRKLIVLDAPPTILANEVTGIFLPKLARLYGTEPVASAIGDMFLKYLDLANGICRFCHRGRVATSLPPGDICEQCEAKFSEEEET